MWCGQRRRAASACRDTQEPDVHGAGVGVVGERADDVPVGREPTAAADRVNLLRGGGGVCGGEVVPRLARVIAAEADDAARLAVADREERLAFAGDEEAVEANEGERLAFELGMDVAVS